MIIATVSPAEKGTFLATVSLTDETGASATPSAATWTLTNTAGTVINSRSAVSLTPAASMKIVLSGDDLAVTDSGDLVRYITLEFTYTSTNGSGLKAREVVRFTIENLLAVT